MIVKPVQGTQYAPFVYGSIKSVIEVLFWLLPILEGFFRNIYMDGSGTVPSCTSLYSYRRQVNLNRSIAGVDRGSRPSELTSTNLYHLMAKTQAALYGS